MVRRKRYSLDPEKERSNEKKRYISSSEKKKAAKRVRYVDVNIAMFNVPVGDYVVRGTWLVNHVQPMDNTQPTMYISYTGNHFDAILSQQ